MYLQPPISVENCMKQVFCRGQWPSVISSWLAPGWRPLCCGLLHCHLSSSRMSRDCPHALRSWVVIFQLMNFIFERYFQLFYYTQTFVFQNTPRVPQPAPACSPLPRLYIYTLICKIYAKPEMLAIFHILLRLRPTCAGCACTARRVSDRAASWIFLYFCPRGNVDGWPRGAARWPLQNTPRRISLLYFITMFTRSHETRR